MSVLITKSRVYRFGYLWFWKCKRPNCHGGRALTWGEAFALAYAHASEHQNAAHRWWSAIERRGA